MKQLLLRHDKGNKRYPYDRSEMTSAQWGGNILQNSQRQRKIINKTNKRSVFNSFFILFP